MRPLVRFNVQVIVEQNGRRESGYAGGGGRYGYVELLGGDTRRVSELQGRTGSDGAEVVMAGAVPHRAVLERLRTAIRRMAPGAEECISYGLAAFRLKGRMLVALGATGPIEFDKNGDIVGPFRLWRIQNGEVTTTGQMSAEEVQGVQARLPR